MTGGGDAAGELIRGAEIVDPAACLPNADDVARRLLGCRLVSLRGGVATGGRIVETEAYLGEADPASHAAARIGRTPRNEPMWGPAGVAYVYFVYGMHWCANVVSGRVGDPQAVLIRALAPTVGLDTIVARRGRNADLTNGPARLCQALAIDGSMDGHRLDRPPLFLLEGSLGVDERVEVTGRIGIREATDWPLRFLIAGHPDVSRAKPRGPRVAETSDTGLEGC